MIGGQNPRLNDVHHFGSVVKIHAHIPKSSNSPLGDGRAAALVCLPGLAKETTQRQDMRRSSILLGLITVTDVCNGEHRRSSSRFSDSNKPGFRRGMCILRDCSGAQDLSSSARPQRVVWPEADEEALDFQAGSCPFSTRRLCE